MKYDNRKRVSRSTGMAMRGMIFAAMLFLHSSYLASTATAQGMVTEIKVVAVQYEDSLAPQARGYSGANDMELDFRKGRGGGYVFALFKKSANSADTTQYITDVVVENNRAAYGQVFNKDGKSYEPAKFFQAKSRYDALYRGGLNGRDYEVYGGAYNEQAHVYVSRTGNTDFKNRVLLSAYVTTSMPKHLPVGSEYSGPHAGGKRYFVFKWHTHESKFNATGDINTHEHFCNRDQCKLFKKEPHKFRKLYGFDTWSIIPKTGTIKDTLVAQSHYKQCEECGQIVYAKHEFATFVSNSDDHTKRCLICDYVEEAGHKNFGLQKLPVDEYYHMIYCDDCGFIKKSRHEFDGQRIVKSLDCEYSMVEYTCKQCFHHAFFEEPGTGHDYDEYGICRRKECLHPFEQPAVEPLGSNDSVYVVKTFGNLYWIADYVNNRRPNTNIRLDNDLIAEKFIERPWYPIGDTDSTAFQGTFDGGGHTITMLQTEEPVAGIGYRGLFGVVGKNGTVKDVAIAACNMRGWNNIGAVAGANNGTISGCHVVFSIMSTIGTGMNLGGICGLNKGTIKGCTTGRDVWIGGVRDYAGGICGTNDGGTLTGNVTEAICGSGTDAVLPETASQQ